MSQIDENVRMNIEEFYAANPRRRHSEELEFGSDWTDGSSRCGVSWVATTGEVYVMREPLGWIAEDPIGDERVMPVREDQLDVEVLGVIEGKEMVEAVMSGWPDAMTQPNSIQWVKDRLGHADRERDDPAAQPSEDLDGY
jgi:hypothetical protein